jgi:periplasmic protein TonB
MFQDALCESAGRQRRSRPATMFAFLLQSMAVAAIVITPLLRIAPPPQVRSLVEPLSFSSPPPPPHPSSGTQESHAGFSQIIGTTVALPRRIPAHPAVINDDNVQPPSILGPGNGVTGGTGTGIGRSIADILAAPVAPVQAPVPTRPAPVSTGVMQGLLLTSVRPAYPRLAQAARIQGAVVLLVTISREGLVENIRVVNGHPMLVGAAMDAVRQWRYRPYLLNGKPIEVETQITVNFMISGG